jgi:hypothetical protein
MASTAVVDKVVKTILQLWPPYRWEDGQEANWIAVLATKISGFSDQVIERMLSELIGKREDRRTPLPAEVIAGCIEAKRWLDVENGQKVLPTLSSSNIPSGLHRASAWPMTLCAARTAAPRWAVRPPRTTTGCSSSTTSVGSILGSRAIPKSLHSSEVQRKPTMRSASSRAMESSGGPWIAASGPSKS